MLPPSLAGVDVALFATVLDDTLPVATLPPLIEFVFVDSLLPSLELLATVDDSILFELMTLLSVVDGVFNEEVKLTSTLEISDAMDDETLDTLEELTGTIDVETLANPFVLSSLVSTEALVLEVDVRAEAVKDVLMLSSVVLDSP